MSRRNNLDEILGFNPPSFSKYTRAIPDIFPVFFHDTHIDENLILKRVKLMPSLFNDLSAAVDDLFPEASRLPAFHDMRYWVRTAYDDTPQKTKAYQISNLQAAGAALGCCRIASSTLIHPDEPSLYSAFSWGTVDCIPDKMEYEDRDFYVQNQGLRIGDINGVDNEDFKQFSIANRKKISSLAERFPVLAVGMFFSPSVKSILEDIGRLAELDKFPWIANSMPKGQTPKHGVSKPHDARETMWTLPKDITPTIRYALRNTAAQSSRLGALSNPKTIATVKRAYICPEPYHFVHRAWANAVRCDATVIVFDCGNFSRIGIRHRQSQTLFLSPSLDVCHSKDPSYGRIWVGLHLAIFHDVLQRQSNIEKMPEVHCTQGPSVSPSKRKAPTLQKGDTKRRKTDTQNSAHRAQSDTDALFASRSVIAVYMQYGRYNSPTPTLLLKPGRKRQTAYKPAEYLTIILDRRLGSGAVGEVYAAHLGPPHSKIKHPPLVVKLATTYEHLCSLRHEYDVYCHLRERRVQGIPHIFGFYQDGYPNFGVLVMSNVGTPFGRRKSSTSSGIALPPAEGEQLRNIISEIHRAGVLHRDVRSWNLMFSPSGEVTVIDFDRASLHAHEDDFEAERQRLERFLGGKSVDGEPMIGAEDMPSNIEDLVNDNLPESN